MLLRSDETARLISTSGRGVDFLKRGTENEPGKRGFYFFGAEGNKLSQGREDSMATL